MQDIPNINSVTSRAKNLRLALKQRFPLVKFSVTSQSYSMGTSIKVCWMDGATTEQVKKITNPFEKVDRDKFGGTLSGGNDFLYLDRYYSKHTYQTALREVWKKSGDNYAVEFKDLQFVDAGKYGYSLYLIQDSIDSKKPSLNQLVRTYLEQVDYCISTSTTSDNQQTETLSKTNQKFDIGDQVRYIGSDYKSLHGVDLIVRDLSNLPWVFCTRKSGTDAPGFTIKDIIKYDNPPN